MPASRLPDPHMCNITHMQARRLNYMSMSVMLDIIIGSLSSRYQGHINIIVTSVIMQFSWLGNLPVGHTIL
jgi:hypothetical protein